MSLSLPTGTVTLLLADVEGSTRLWENQPKEMTAAVARLDRTVTDIITAHHGVRPVEQGEGDSFVVAFTRAADAVACALALQCAPLALIRLRLGVHTGDVQLRDDGNYIGPAINRTARLRDLAHGGQTVLSGTTSDLVADQLPTGAWLSDLGTHPLRDLPRPERVVQLCHPDLRSEFPPLRTREPVAALNLPVQLTSFVARDAEVAEVRRLLGSNRLVTLTGAGGAGKTRLAVQVATRTAPDFSDGVWFVDLAPITDPDLVPLAVARGLGLPDQPGRSTMDSVTHLIADRRALVVLDNCEHLIDACADLIVALLRACQELTLMATSREPIAVAGEVTYRVPSLSLDTQAVELFTERAKRSRSDFEVAEEDSETVTEICRRLDGMPLAIELAAARVRALSVTDILAGLHDRFRLLTGGGRTAVPRQQTLRASVDWSHALLTEPEQVLFRRLAAFMGGFDLDAAQVVGGIATGAAEVECDQILDLLTLLVDKSLVVPEAGRGATRYRFLETVRQYAQQKLHDSGEADAVRARHRDHYAAMASRLDATTDDSHHHRIEQAELEIDNLRAAFTWSREHADIETALALTSALQPLWITRGRVQEGRAWFDAVVADQNVHHLAVTPAARARMLADKGVLDGWVGASDFVDRAEEAVVIARGLDDPTLLARVLTARGLAVAHTAELAQPYFAEAAGLARMLGDRWRLSQILSRQANVAMRAGDAVTIRAAGEEGLEHAEAIGDRFESRQCRWQIATADCLEGRLTTAEARFQALLTEADEDHDVILRVSLLMGLTLLLAYLGDTSGARVAADAGMASAAEFGDFYLGATHGMSTAAALATGDIALATAEGDATLRYLGIHPQMSALHHDSVARAALARGDLVAARRWADSAASATSGWYRAVALTTRARVAAAEGRPSDAERDIHDSLTCADVAGSPLAFPDTLECLAALATGADRHADAARLFGAADAIRAQMRLVRFKIYQPEYDAAVLAARNTLGDNDFEQAWTEGAQWSADEVVAFAHASEVTHTT